MAEVEFAAGSLSIVDDWLGGGSEGADAHASGLQQPDDMEMKKEGREARLGLGAKFQKGAQSRTVFSAEQKMIHKLKGKKHRSNNANIEAAVVQQPSEEGEESRTSSVSKKKANAKPVETKKKKKKKKKQKKNVAEEGQDALPAAQDNQNDDEDEGVPAGAPNMDEEKGVPASAPPAGNAPAEVSAEEAKAQASPEEGDATNASEPQQEQQEQYNSSWTGFAPVVARKRKKTRSKRKNMKKDTRSADKKPTYLTPGAADYDLYRGGTRKSNLKARRKQFEELKKLENTLRDGADGEASKMEGKPAAQVKKDKVEVEVDENVFFIDKKSRGASLDLQLNKPDDAATTGSKKKKKGKRKYKNIAIARTGAKAFNKQKPKKKKKQGDSA